MNEYLNGTIIESIAKIEVLKTNNMKETLEEREFYWDLVNKKAEQNNLINLDAYAKWMQGKMYNQIDLEVAFYEGMNGDSSFSEWFENFKNK